MKARKIPAMAAGLLLMFLTGTGLAQNQQTRSKGDPPPAGVQKQQMRKAQHTIRDANRDGVCDVCKQSVGSGQKNTQGKKADKGKHWGPGDGSGRKDNPPKDGTGYGAGSGKRGGSMDGTGMKRGNPGRPGPQPGMNPSKGRGQRRGRN